MEQRKQIEEQLYMELDNINKGFPSNFIEAIMQLIPQWKKFGEDCKPGVGDWFLYRRGLDNNSISLPCKWTETSTIDFYKTFQFLTLPD